jgi:hypothetical protein
MNARAPRPPITSRFRGALAASLVAAVAAAVFAAAPLAATPALAADGDVSWGVRTGSNDNGTDRQNYLYAVDPGGQIHDTLIVSNHDDVPLDLDVYAADGFTTESGQLDVLAHDETSVSLGTWIDVDTDHVQVPAGGELELPFTLSVPVDATPGDYAGGILTSLTQATQEQGISVDRRLGIRVHLRVAGALAPALAIEDLRVDYAGTINPFGVGDASVSYTVHNTGNVRLSAAQAVKVAGPFGLLPMTASAVSDAPELLPGESWKMTVPVAGVFPAFLLNGTVAIDPALAAELADQPGSDSGLGVVEANADGWAVPWALLGLVLLVAAVVVGGILYPRRRRRVRASSEEARVQDAVAEALREREAETVSPS